MYSGSDWRDFDEHLIIAVQKYRVLYDKTLKDFKNLWLKANACEAVAKAVTTNGRYAILK